MYISTKDWKNYIYRLSALDQKAGELMQEWIRKHGFSDTQAMIDYAYAVAQKYGEGSAALAAEMYDAVAEMAGKMYPPAVAARAPGYSEVAKTVNGILGAERRHLRVLHYPRLQRLAEDEQEGPEKWPRRAYPCEL